jgi:2-C-methyl-D-erythritol 4-phosphate cytidylyltransferase
LAAEAGAELAAGFIPFGADMVYAIIVAGGRGSRLAGPIAKQYRQLAGVPILTRTLRVFDGCRAVDRLVVVVPAADIEFVRTTILEPAALRKNVVVVAGGAQRQDSVWNGLAAVAPEAALVVIHDAVRPLVTCETITACIDAARRYGACIVGLPVWDTLKRISDSGCIEATLPRERVWMAQTPQAFRVDLLRTAHQRARREAVLGTDDANLVERSGAAVHMVPGSPSNIKITTAEDLALAEALLSLAEAGPHRMPR